MRSIVIGAWLILCMLSGLALRSQCNISGTLADSLHAPAAYCAVGLLNAVDSSVVKGAMTDDQGAYCFEQLPKGDFILKVSAVGYKPYFSEKISYDSLKPLELQPIVLRSGGIDLNEVSVSAQKKVVEFKNGNITVNVEGTALAMGNTAYDLLLRLPGVIVSGDEISIQGKGGVKFMIDNKLQQLSGQQLINTLKSINASQIEKIEVLKKPPVRYDAAGSGGMINIKTTKVKLVGFSGNAYGTFSQGFYGNPSGGFTLNYKGRKVNFFSGFYADREWRHMVNTYTSHVNYQGEETVLYENHIEKEHNHYETYNLGADWFINKYNSIGIRANGAFGMGRQDRAGSYDVSDNSLGYRTLNSGFQKDNPWIYPEFNLNAEHLFDTLGTALRYSCDYSPYWDIYRAGFESRFLDEYRHEVAAPDVFRTSNTLTFNTLNNRLDFEKQATKTLKIEAGLKHSYQEMLSDYLLQNLDYGQQVYITNPEFTNVYLYKQNISAGYVNLMKDYKKFSFQAGVRGENTTINTVSKTAGSGFLRQYFNLFPMLSIDYKLSDKHDLQVSYNKRINRPDYNSYNPFRSFNSLLFSQQGNPYLKPEYAHSVDFTYSYNQWMSHTLSFTRTYNSMIGYATLNDSSKVNTGTTGNLNYSDIYSYSLFIQKDLKKWWNVNVNATVYSMYAKGTINGQPYSMSTLGFNPGIYSRFALPKDYSVELNAFYLNPVIEGVAHFKARNMVNVSFKKSMLDKKLSMAVAFNDIFFGLATRASANYQNQRSSTYYRFDTRRINISLNYNFGRLKVQQREISDKDEGGKSGK